MVALRDPYHLRIGAGAIRPAIAVFALLPLGPVYAALERLRPLVLAYALLSCILLVLIILRIGDRPRAIAGAIVDMSMITLLVHVMGSTTSFLTTTYVFASVLNTLTVGARVGYLVAFLACASYGGLLVGEHLGLVQLWSQGPPVDPLQGFASWAITSFMLVTTTLIVATLLESNARRELELREANDRLLALTNRDPLTDLWNRRYLFERIARAIEKQKLGKFALAVFDLDGFKDVNDRFGHLGGDALLQAVAQAIVKEAGPRDVVCRFGGDEFVVMFRDESVERNSARVEAMCRGIADAARTFAADCVVTASVGLTMSRVTDDATDLIRRADDLAYRAKRAGKNRVVGDAGERV